MPTSGVPDKEKQTEQQSKYKNKRSNTLKKNTNHLKDVKQYKAKKDLVIKEHVHAQSRGRDCHLI